MLPLQFQDPASASVGRQQVRAPGTESLLPMLEAQVELRPPGCCGPVAAAVVWVLGRNQWTEKLSPSLCLSHEKQINEFKNPGRRVYFVRNNFKIPVYVESSKSSWEMWILKRLHMAFKSFDTKTF